MSITTAPPVATGASICNAESGFLFRSNVLTALRCEKSSVLHLQTVAGLSETSPCKFTRDRWEITQGKIFVLDQLEETIAALPVIPALQTPQNLTVEKPASSFRSELESVRESVFRLRGSLLGIPISDAVDSAFHRASDAVAALNAILDKLSGSAEEQPQNRETSSPPIVPGGAVTADCSISAPEPSRFDYLEAMPLPALQELSEAVLDSLESRGVVTHWSLTGA